MGMPWRYVVHDGEGDDCLCTLHAKQAHNELVAFLASLRFEHGEFNARQLDKVAAMEAGVLVRLVKQKADGVQRRLQEVVPVVEDTKQRGVDVGVLLLGDRNKNP
jgi:hypothetical protein